MLLSRRCHLDEWGTGTVVRSGTEVISEKDESSNEMPRWLEATSGFWKSSPSGPKSLIVNSGKIIQNGGRVLKVPLKVTGRNKMGLKSAIFTYWYKRKYVYIFCRIESRFQEKVEMKTEQRVNLNATL